MTVSNGEKVVYFISIFVEVSSSSLVIDFRGGVTSSFSDF